MRRPVLMRLNPAMPLLMKPMLRETAQPCALEHGRTFFLAVGTEILDASRPVPPEQAIVAPGFAALRMLHPRPIDEQADFLALSGGSN